MSQSPPEWVKNLQTMAQQQGRRFGGAGGGPPRGTVGVIGGALILGGALYAFNNAIFNGMFICSGSRDNLLTLRF